MKKNAFAIASLMTLSLLCGACTVIAPASSGSDSSLDSSGHSQPSPLYTVCFYLVEGEEYRSVLVEDGECVECPADPEREGYVFEGWYTDKECTAPFDFKTKVTHGLSLYAKWKEEGDFSQFDERFVTSYSPFVQQTRLFIGDVDPLITLTAKDIAFHGTLSAKQIYLGGVFYGMGIQRVEVKGNDINLALSGMVKEGTGIIAFAKEVTPYNEYFTTKIDVRHHGLYLDHSSAYFVQDYRNYKYVWPELHFKLCLDGEEFHNPDHLSAQEFGEKLKSGELPYFQLVDNADEFGWQIQGVSDDFKSVDMNVTFPGENATVELIEKLANVGIRASKDAFVSGYKDYRFALDFKEPTTTTSLEVGHVTQTKYNGRFTIRFNNGFVVNPELTDNAKALLQDPFNKNLFVSLPDRDVVAQSLSFPDERTIQGVFAFDSETEPENKTAVIDLSDIKLSEETSIHMVMKPYPSDVGETLVPENVSYEIGVNKTETGKVSQTAFSSYSGIRRTVQSVSFEQGEGEEDLEDLGTVISGATGIAKIGFGVSSGDYTMAKNAVGDLFGIDDFRCPTTVIQEQLKAIFEELKVIESKLDNISEQLELVQAELESIGKQTLLTNFLAAHSSWIDFVTDYYTPLTDQIALYTNQYFRYYYDFVTSTYGKEVTLKLHYDTDGNLNFPADNGAFSVDGKAMDYSKTKEVVIHEAASALMGIRSNKGHAYGEIEDDLIADIANREHYDDALLLDIAKTIRFHAMKSCFGTNEKADEFTNVFANFCRSLSGTQLQAAINPLDAYTIMLETIYNFGFELEPELNLALIKLTTTYHCGERLFNFVNSINGGAIVNEKTNAEMKQKVADELSDERYFHSNDENGNAYCYAAGTYVSLNINSYAIYFLRDHDDSDNSFTNIVVNCLNDPDGPGLGEFRSISEADAQFMMLKTKVLNQVKRTNYTFKEYFASIGVIPANMMARVHGVVLDIEGIAHGEDDVKDLTYDDILVDDYGGWYDEQYVEKLDVEDSKAIEGKMISFKDEKTYTGIVVICCDPFREWGTDIIEWSGGYHYQDGGYVDWQKSGDDFYGGGAYAYYLNIAPIN